MAGHRIHLKGPWEFRPLCHFVSHPDASSRESNREATVFPELPLPSGGMVKFPALWGEFLGTFCGEVLFRRPFNRPTNLSSKHCVDLVLEGIGGSCAVQINGIDLGQISADVAHARFEITRHLQPHNLLELKVCRETLLSDSSGPCHVVYLEIFDNDTDREIEG